MASSTNLGTADPIRHPRRFRNLLVYVTDLDCASLVEAYPNLTSLRLWGSPGWVRNVGELNRLHTLRTFSVFDVFGMTAADCLDPGRLTNMESIQLESIPADFAAAMRRTWTPEASNGMYLTVTKRANLTGSTRTSPTRCATGTAALGYRPRHTRRR